MLPPPQFVHRIARVIVLAVLAAIRSLPAAAPAVPPFRLGLNDVFLGNDAFTTAQHLAAFKEVGATGLRHLQPNDVQWGSVQSGSGQFTFTQADSVLASAYGFGFLPTLYGNGAQNFYVPPGTAPTAAWSAATYGAQTTTYLQTVVNRYKGTVKYWEIGNEMNTKTTPPAGFSAADYAAFLLFNRNAIRAADPSAQIVIAGTLGNYGYPIANAYQWLRDVLAAGGAAGFDVFNFHDYKSWWTLPTHYDQYRAILDANGLQAMPIWVTETAQASAISSPNINPAYASVDGQAADVWRRPCVLFGKGAQTVFWDAYWVNPVDPSGFHDMGLVSGTTGIRKKSWHSMKLLNQKIEGFATATMVASGVSNDDNVTGGSGNWVVRFDFTDGTKRWVAWSPDAQSITLTGLTNVTGVNLTIVVPASVSADGLSATWTVSSRTVANGSLTLALADAPILIEIAASTPPAPTVTVPAISAPPTTQTVTTGSNVTFTVAATGTAPFTYQWLKNGTTISGATSPSYLIAAVTGAAAGNYAVIVTNAAGSVTSSAATLTVNPAAALSNLSVRTTLATAQTVTVGLVVSGGAKPVLIRAAGPALAGFGLTSAMADPRLELYQGTTKLAENDNWAAALSPTFTSLGAFAFPSASKDAALLQTLGGAYTVQVTGTGAGLVLVEGYDAGASGPARLINVSARNRVGTGADLLIAGFTVMGTGPFRVLIRAVGPTLAGFGVTGPLADPKLELYNAASTKITESDDWAASLAATFSAVGAFALPAGSKDAALLATLTAGQSYTVQVSGVANTTGEALVEIYEAP